MGFVGNYALGGLSPQIYDMPVIQRKRYPDSRRSTVKHKHKIKHDKTTIFPVCQRLAAIESAVGYSHILLWKSNGRIVL
jgi:hypothetical protein